MLEPTPAFVHCLSNVTIVKLPAELSAAKPSAVALTSLYAGIVKLRPLMPKPQILNDTI